MKKKEYIAPEMTEFTVNAELGYAASGDFLGLCLGEEDGDDDGQETWQVDNYSGAGWTND
jgi:hypothetical protein